MKRIKINERDNVAVMLDGDLRGHKIALTDIKAGEDVIKYGYPIGHAVVDIKTGEHVHTHNIKTNLSGTLKYTYEPKLGTLKRGDTKTFMGYVREDGS